MSKRWMTGVAALLCFAVVVPVSAKDPKEQGFSGKWVLDKKSFQGSEPLGDLRQNIKVSGSEVVIQSTFPEPATAVAPLVYLGIMTSTLRLTTDGQDATNQIGPYNQVSKTTVQGNKMTTEWHSEINGDPVQGKWVRTLSDDGRQTTLEITETSTKGQQGNAMLTLRRK